MTAILCDYVLYNSQGQAQRRRKTVLTTCVTAAKTQAQAKWAEAEKKRAKEMFSWKGYGEIFEHHGDGKRKVEADHANVNTVHLYLLWIYLGFLLFHSAAGKQSKHDIGCPLSPPAVTLSCLLLVCTCTNKDPRIFSSPGSRNVYQWGWSARVAWRVIVSGPGARNARHLDSLLCRLLFTAHLPTVHRLTPGARTGRPVSETRRACGWSPSCSTDVSTGWACHSSWRVDSSGGPIVWQREPSLQF